MKQVEIDAIAQAGGEAWTAEFGDIKPILCNFNAVTGE
jgi:hypothetical protein